MGDLVEAVSEVMLTVESTFSELFSIWQYVGLTQQQRTSRINIAIKCIKDLVSAMLQDEKEMSDTVCKNVEDLKLALSLLLNQLHLEQNINLDGLSLIQKQNKLKTEHEVLEQMKNKRLNHYHQLRNKEVSLTYRLQLPCFPLSPDDVPDEDYLDKMARHVSQLEKKETLKMQELIQLRERIHAIIQQLDYDSFDDFEKEAINGPAEEFILTAENFQKLQDLEETLQKVRQDRMQTVGDMMQKIKILWDRLKTPKEYRDQFHAQCNSLSLSTVSKMQEELTSLEKLKCEKIEDFVKEIREELKVYWSQCFWGPQQTNFPDFHSEEFSEELLKKHEDELERVKNFYEEMSDFYRILNKWDKLWSHLLFMEQNKKNPDRLHNRGGALLKEERDRRHIQKEIPFLEKKLRSDIEVWENEHNQTFRIADKPFEEYLADRYNVLLADKENEKQNKKTGANKLGSSHKKRMMSPFDMNQPSSQSKLSNTRKAMPVFASNENVNVNPCDNVLQADKTTYGDFLDNSNSTTVFKETNSRKRERGNFGPPLRKSPRLNAPLTARSITPSQCTQGSYSTSGKLRTLNARVFAHKVPYESPYQPRSARIQKKFHALLT